MTIRATTNDITGDEIRTHYNSKNYVEGWERIWGNKDNEARNIKDTDTKPARRTKIRG